jgi:hypothetical protein
MLSSVIVPRKLRRKWREEWEAELGYRQPSGAWLRDFARAARGCIRDAVWVRSRTPVDWTFMTTPLRPECILSAVAVAAALWFGALTPVRPDYANLDRLLRLERSKVFLGPINARLLASWRAAASVERIAPYRTLFYGSGAGRFAYARVSPDFFDALGVKPWSGRPLTAEDPPYNALITFAFWRDRLHSDPGAVGASFSAGNRTYSVTGILGPTFGFHRASFFAPLGAGPAPEALALLKPGFTRDRAEAELLQIARQLNSGKGSAGISLQPLVSRVAVSSILVAALAALLPLACLAMRRRWMKAYASARIAVTLVAVTLLNAATARAVNRLFVPLSVVQLWVFLGLCAAAVYLILRDHHSRCPQCLTRLQMPVAMGTWSSLLMDPPVTEYVCPNGHGTLAVSDAMHDPDRWTVFDESWKDLFARPAQ